jgi:hypothetical protein
VLGWYNHSITGILIYATPRREVVGEYKEANKSKLLYYVKAYTTRVPYSTIKIGAPIELGLLTYAGIYRYRPS